jgi:hypothetical protein
LFEEQTQIPVTSRVTEIHEDMTFEEAVTDAYRTNTVAWGIPRNTEIEQFSEYDESGYFFNPK